MRYRVGNSSALIANAALGLGQAADVIGVAFNIDGGTITDSAATSEAAQ